MISLEKVNFNYGKKKIFENFSISFELGHIYGLLGKNGSGKSTFLKLIAGLIFPKSGDIKVLEQNPQKRHPSLLSDLYLIPEEFNLPDVNISALLKYYAPFYPRFRSEEFSQYIEEFEVPKDSKFSEMSLGQKKKAVISFGLACNTSVLLMDEPTNGLDIMSKAQFKKVMQKAHKTTQLVIISTHQSKDLESLIDRVTIIDEKGILFDENVKDILSKITFQISDKENDIAKALYSEDYNQQSKSLITALEQSSKQENKLDLELLYKAIVSKPSFVPLYHETKAS